MSEPHRKTWLRSKKPMRRRSRKQQALYDERVPIMRAAMIEGRRCQACPLIADVDLAAANRCQIRAVDWHERLYRSRGGSIVDEANGLWVCRQAHDWIHAHPIEAKVLGLAESRYGTA